MSEKLKFAVIGCGLIGQRRTQQITDDGMGEACFVYDINAENAAVGAKLGRCEAVHDPERIWTDDRIQAVIIATPNQLMCDYAVPVLESGKHLFLEKPGVCSEAQYMKLMVAKQNDRQVIKVGFNHRFHPAALKLHSLLSTAKLNERPLWVRAAYGHGGRPGYGEEWRMDPTLSGGGQTIDQGVHLLDLASWFLGAPLHLRSAKRFNAYYDSTSDDNGMLLAETSARVPVEIHCSVNQWKNLFRFELATSHRLFVWQGLGNRNYGPETLTVHERLEQGGMPTTDIYQFGENQSWRREWEHFCSSVMGKTDCYSELSTLNWLYLLLDQFHRTDFETYERKQ